MTIDETIEFAEEQAKWIPISERLPEKDGVYIVTFKWKGSYSGDVYTEVTASEYCVKHKTWALCEDYDIIAYMPLPQPYKEDSE